MLDVPAAYVLKRLDPEKAKGFAELEEKSRLEGFWMLVRLAESWHAGRNRFSRRGETLLGAWLGDALVGVGGLNVDPYVSEARQGRVRHVYVDPAHRRGGVGRLLAEAIIERARKHFPVLNVRAPETAFSFYEALGFKRVEGEEFATHRMTFAKRRVTSAPPRRRSAEKSR